MGQGLSEVGERVVFGQSEKQSQRQANDDKLSFS